jgi:hypothetical protein
LLARLIVHRLSRLGILAPENLCLLFFSLAIRFVGGSFISSVNIYLVLINHEMLMAEASGNDCCMHPGVFGSCKGSHKGYICQLLVNTVEVEVEDIKSTRLKSLNFNPF